MDGCSRRGEGTAGLRGGRAARDTGARQESGELAIQRYAGPADRKDEVAPPSDASGRRAGQRLVAVDVGGDGRAEAPAVVGAGGVEQPRRRGCSRVGVPARRLASSIIASVNPSVASRPPGLLAFGEPGRNASDAAAVVGACAAPQRDVFVAPLVDGPLCSRHGGVRGSEHPGGRRALPEAAGVDCDFQGLAPQVAALGASVGAPLAGSAVGRSGAGDEAEGVELAKGRATRAVSAEGGRRVGAAGTVSTEGSWSARAGVSFEVLCVVGPSTGPASPGPP